MRCPVDGTTLLLAERQQVELDYCPECRGVWLDRGELDKLVRRDDDVNSHDDTPSRNAQPRRRKNKGWLSDIFEFGG